MVERAPPGALIRPGRGVLSPQDRQNSMSIDSWLIGGFVTSSALLVTLVAFGVAWGNFHRALAVIGLTSFYLYLVNHLLQSGEWIGIAFSFPAFLLVVVFQTRVKQAIDWVNSLSTRMVHLFLSPLYFLYVLDLLDVIHLPDAIRMPLRTTLTIIILTGLLWSIWHMIRELLLQSPQSS